MSKINKLSEQLDNQNSLTEIDPSALYLIIVGWRKNDVSRVLDTHEFLNWETVESTIISADPEDGGADHEIVLKHLPSGKFYLTYYSDWDIDNTDFDRKTFKVGKRCDLRCDLTEVEAKEVKQIIYVPVNRGK